MKTKYYEIDNMQFKLEQIESNLCRLTIKGVFTTDLVHHFRGATAYADAMEEILSYTEIDEKDYGEEVI